MPSATFTVPASPAEVDTGAVEGEYSHNQEHAAEAVSHLIEFYRQGPRNQALMNAIAAQIQEAEDAAWAVHTAFDLDTAVGHQLELLGKLVGEYPAGRTDAAFRAAIRVRILVNRSEGTLPELMDIADLISPAGVIRTRELYPAAIAIEADTWGDLSLQEAYALLRRAKPAGVRLNLTEGPFAIGAADGTPLGGTIGAADGTPLGFTIGGGT